MEPLSRRNASTRETAAAMAHDATRLASTEDGSAVAHGLAAIALALVHVGEVLADVGDILAAKD